MEPKATVRQAQRDQARNTLNARLADLLLIDEQPMLYLQRRGIQTIGGKSVALLLPFFLDRQARPWFAAPDLGLLLDLPVTEEFAHPMIQLRDVGPHPEDQFAVGVSSAWFGRPDRLHWTILR
jgi:hypothetical protein